VRYACIDRCRDLYPIRLMCRLLDVAASGYYAWRRRPEPRRIARNRELLDKIRSIHEASKGSMEARGFMLSFLPMASKLDAIRWRD